MMMPAEWGVPHLELVLQVHRHVTESSSFESHQRVLAVGKKGDVVAGSDMYIGVAQLRGLGRSWLGSC